MKLNNLLFFAIICCFTTQAIAQEELIKYGNFEQWIQRDIKESSMIGGKKKTLMEIGPTAHWTETKPYTNQGGSPWATSNVYAKVSGVLKTNASVFKDEHDGGSCAKLYTHIEKVKVLGMININVLASGSVFTGKMIEPITSTKKPMSKMCAGIPFTKRPRAIKFDYKVQLSNEPNRIRKNGFSKEQVINGKDMPEVIVLLQQRSEDAQGNITAKRVATLRMRFANSTGWVNGKIFELQYGDITHKSFYKPFMGLINGDNAFYTTNSKGKIVVINEDGWAQENATPTHAIIKFDSSYGGPYIGSEGTTLWIDNVKWVY
ncbi:MAG TPA: glycoside hydrolase xylanase [Prevotellaceae bacterium]|nr:glycoside hydrolase xylanase [Prevotellaceae bacterium]